MEEKQLLIDAFYIGQDLSLKKLRSDFTATLICETESELFYRLPDERYLYVFDYGVVVFANTPDVEMSQTLRLLQNYIPQALTEKFRDTHTVHVRPRAKKVTYSFNELYVPQLSEDTLKVIMLNAAQSVALDYYAKESEKLLSEVRHFTDQLEQTGTMKISRKNMLKFIGKALNNKNQITENLYLFDHPDLVWEDEYLDAVNAATVKLFDLPLRFKEIEYTFKIIEDNLSIFRELYMHRESSIMEWIIIVLILIEVVDLFVGKLL